MEHWQQNLVTPETPILAVIELIERESIQFALVVDDQRRFLGTVTDGDVRRGILRGIDLKSPVSEIMNASPRSMTEQVERSVVLATMRADAIRHMPIVDASGRVIGLETLDELVSPKQRDNWVVIMAGGLGSRLHPLTLDTPKPLLEVGGKPILETIISNFANNGFHNMFISVNYRAIQVQDYFGDGSQWGINIQYLREEKSLGTAGALSLLPEKTDLPVIVMNGDILTTTNFTRILDFHQEHKASATMCVREKSFQIPYGVVEIQAQKFISIEEKPSHRLLVNAGIYLINPEVLDLLPKNQPMDMPQLFEQARGRFDNVFVFPISEYWLDIGQADDFAQAHHDYTIHFEE